MTFRGRWWPFSSRCSCNRLVLFGSGLWGSCYWHSRLWLGRRCSSCTPSAAGKWDCVAPGTIPCFGFGSNRCLSILALSSTSSPAGMRSWCRCIFRCALSRAILLWRSPWVHHQWCSHLGDRSCSCPCRSRRRDSSHQYPLQPKSPLMPFRTSRSSDRPFLSPHRHTCRCSHSL